MKREKNQQHHIGMNSIERTNSEKFHMKADLISIVIVYDEIIQQTHLICAMLWMQRL